MSFYTVEPDFNLLSYKLADFYFIHPKTPTVPYRVNEALASASKLLARLYLGGFHRLVLKLAYL